MSSNQKFKDKVIVVTGAGGTLCSAMAIRLAEQGAKVVAVGRTVSKLDAVIAQITADGGTAKAYGCDVTDEKGLQAICDDVVKNWGTIDGLINGAGGNQAEATTTVNEFVPE